MKTLWRVLKVVGYIIGGIFAVNLLYVFFIYAVRHEGWFFIHNPTFGSHSNSDLAWQIIWSIILVLLGWGLISLSRKKLKSVTEKPK